MLDRMGKTKASLAVNESPTSHAYVDDLIMPIAENMDIDVAVQYPPAEGANLNTVAAKQVSDKPDVAGVIALPEDSCTSLFQSLRRQGYDDTILAGSCSQFINAMGADAAGIVTQPRLWVPLAKDSAPAEVQDQLTTSRTPWTRSATATRRRRARSTPSPPSSTSRRSSRTRVATSPLPPWPKRSRDCRTFRRLPDHRRPVTATMARSRHNLQRAGDLLRGAGRRHASLRRRSRIRRPGPSRCRPPGDDDGWIRHEYYLQFVVLGLGLGAVYIGLANGLLLVYRSTGIINFAQGATAMWGAYVYAQLRLDGTLVLPSGAIEFGEPPSVAVASGDRAGDGRAARRAHPLPGVPPRRHAPALAQVVVSVALMLTMQALVVIRFGPNNIATEELVPAGSVSTASVPRYRLPELVMAAAMS